MTYAPIDDRFDDHPRYAELGAAEMGVIACAITYATRNLSDGRVPRVWPARRFGRDGSRLAKHLVDLGIWSVRPDGDFEIVGFLEHNLSREEVLSKRTKRAAAGSLGGRASWERRTKATGPPNGEAFASPHARASAEAAAEAAAEAPAEPLNLNSLQRSEREISLSKNGLKDLESARATSTLAPTPRLIDPNAKLSAEQRAIAQQLTVQDIDGAWLGFVGHCQSRGILSCDFTGEWKKWVVRARNIERRDRDKDADRGAQAGPGPTGKAPEPPEAVRARERSRDADYARLKRDAVPPPSSLAALIDGRLAATGIRKAAPPRPDDAPAARSIPMPQELTEDEGEARRQDARRRLEQFGETLSASEREKT